MLVTAVVTPFDRDGTRPCSETFERLVRFQLSNGADRVLVAGTTGEGALLDEHERQRLLEIAVGVSGPERVMVALGAGRLDQVVERGLRALGLGVRDQLLADCPYVGASSAGLREGWYAPVAEALPDVRLVAYAVPSRTGCELLPDDLARLVEDHPSVVGVKDATGRRARMLRVRELCGDALQLYCGEDHLLGQVLVDPMIRADGAISFCANLVPRAFAELLAAGRAGDAARVRELSEALAPLTALVSITAEETLVARGVERRVPQRVRNPVPIKTALAMLGAVEPTCRRPLGPLGPAGRAQVRGILRESARIHPSLWRPLVEELGLDLALAGADTHTPTRTVMPGRSTERRPLTRTLP